MANPGAIQTDAAVSGGAILSAMLATSSTAGLGRRYSAGRRIARRLPPSRADCAGAPKRNVPRACDAWPDVHRGWPRPFGRDRTTAAHACRKIEDRRTELQLDAALAELEHALRRDLAPDVRSRIVSRPTDRNLPKSAVALLTALAAAPDGAVHQRADSGDVDLLVLADLVRHEPLGRLQLTEAGRARIRRDASTIGEIDPFRAQHLSLARRLVATPDSHADVAFDEAESPLAWLARRKGRDGKPLIEPVQYQAGERLRADFTRANLTPNVTSSWDASRAGSRPPAPARRAHRT